LGRQLYCRPGNSPTIQGRQYNCRPSNPEN
jgi:hypothetical protein